MTSITAEYLDFKIQCVLTHRDLVGIVLCAHINFIAYLGTKVGSVLLL